MIITLLKSSQLKQQLISSSKVGSSYICTPAPTNTDIDYLILCKDIGVTMDILINAFRFTQDSVLYGDTKFISLKKTYLNKLYNIILTADRDFYASFIFATELSKQLNILNKADRVSIHAIIRNYWKPNMQLKLTLPT